MRLPTFRFLATVLGLLMLVARIAGANVVGTDAQNFNPTTNGLDFVTVQSSETLKPGYFNMGFYLNQAWDALPRFKGQPGYDDRLLGMDLNLGVGFTNRWDAGVSVPSVLNQSVSDSSGFRGRYSSNGITETKVNTKVRLSGELDGGFAAVASTNFNLIENNPYVGRNSGPTLNLEMVYDRTFGDIGAAINVGHRWRKPGTAIPGIPIRPFGNQWIASLGGNYRVEKWDSRLVAEVFGSLPTSATNENEDRQASSLEMLLGIKHDFSNNIAGHFGVGREILSGLASPNFRIYTGVNFQFGPVFNVKDEHITGAAGATSAEEVFTLRKIPFAYNSAELSPAAKPILDELAEHLRKGFKSLQIAGHTDSLGADSYNERLSENRANSIRSALITTYGFEASKITAKGFGESRPIADNGNYQGREMNRRVEFTLAR